MKDYLIVKFEEDYADEFDVHGFAVMTKGDYVEFLKQAIYSINENEEVEYGFGSNEWITFDIDNLKFECKEIHQYQADFLKENLLKYDYTYGHFPLYAFENIKSSSFWELNAVVVKNKFNTEVNSEEEYYICPKCGKRVYKKDYNREIDFYGVYCPICKYVGEEF